MINCALAAVAVAIMSHRVCSVSVVCMLFSMPKITNTQEAKISSNLAIQKRN